MSIIKEALKLCFPLLVKISPVLASKILYYNFFGKRLDLKNPITFNEKLMWLKLYEDDALKTKCTDKYLVRNYVSDKGHAHILIDAYQVYESIEEINFDVLPSSFVMKCTHGSGFNIICPNKDKWNKDETIMQLKKWMERDYSLVSCEPHYSKIKPRIVVEKFLGGSDGKLPIDYKIHCFHGEPQIIDVALDRGTKEKKHILLNCKWKVLPYSEDSINYKKEVSKPEKIEEMLQIARELSKEFTYVRVDLYYYDNEIYFGELTFTPAACLDTDYIESYSLQMGKLLDLTFLRNGTSIKRFKPEHLKLK